MSTRPAGIIANLSSHDGHITISDSTGIRTIRADQLGFAAAVTAFKAEDWDALRTALDNKATITSYFKDYGDLKIDMEDQILYKDEVLGGTIVKRIMSFISEGLNEKPLIKFLANLMENPSRASRVEFYDFLEHRNIPIDENGFVLAYKGVNANYTDKHSGKFDNTPGQVISMPRRDVDDDRRNECSYGFHVGSIEYAAMFAGAGGKVVIVRVNPKDVVSVPQDYNGQKCRVCEYTVLEDYTGDLPENYRPSEGYSDDEYDDDEYNEDEDNDEDEDSGDNTDVQEDLDLLAEALNRVNDLRDRIADKVADKS